MTDTPHTSRTGPTTHGESPNTSAASTQHDALTRIAHPATLARPSRSPSRPAPRHPTTPASPITVNAVSPTTVRPGAPPEDAVRLAAT